MGDMKWSYIAGFIVGLLLVVLVKFLFDRRKTEQKKGCDYDERQQLARGEAFKYGFFTLFAWVVFTSVICEDGMPQWCSLLVLNMTGVGLALLVFGCYCIAKDAYMSLREKPLSMYIVTGVAGFSNLGVALHHFGEQGGLFEDGKLGLSMVNLILGIVFIVLLAVFFAKMRQNQEETE